MRDLRKAAGATLMCYATALFAALLMVPGQQPVRTGIASVLIWVGSRLLFWPAKRPPRPDVTREGVIALRIAADNMPLRRPGQSWEGAADWLHRRADGIEAHLTGSPESRSDS